MRPLRRCQKKRRSKAGLYENIGAAIDDRYMEELKKNVLHPNCIKEVEKDLRIVYTPLHGTGNIPVRRVLKELGFTNVFVVPEQELPDGEFPTVSYPNPGRREKPLNWLLPLPKKRMPTSFWRQTRMPTASVFM